MTIEEIRAAYWADPFKPFRVHLEDGRRVLVKARYFLGIMTDGRRIVLSLPDDTFDVVPLMAVKKLEFMRKPPRARTKQSPRGAKSRRVVAR